MMDWTAISVIVAGIGILYTARLRRVLSRKQHTLTSLVQVNFNTEYIDAMKRVSKMLRLKVSPPPLGEDEADDEEVARDISAVKLILNYYEFLCAGLRNGDIDESLLNDARGGAIRRAYQNFKPYIDGRREALGSRTTYEDLEWFYERHNTKDLSLVRCLIEWWIGRPHVYRRRDSFSYFNRLLHAWTAAWRKMREKADI